MNSFLKKKYFHLSSMTSEWVKNFSYLSFLFSRNRWSEALLAIGNSVKSEQKGSAPSSLLIQIYLTHTNINIYIYTHTNIHVFYSKLIKTIHKMKNSPESLASGRPWGLWSWLELFSGMATGLGSGGARGFLGSALSMQRGGGGGGGGIEVVGGTKTAAETFEVVLPAKARISLALSAGKSLNTRTWPA